MSKTFLYLLVILSFSIITNSNAQRYPFYNLSVENGLIQSQVTAIEQDAMGHLWMGTIGGLAKYDGKTFTNYTIRDGLLNNSITALGIDKQNQIWIGGPNGVTKYNGREFKHFIFRAPENANANAVSKLKVAPNNTIWCIVAGSVFSIKDNQYKELPLPNLNAGALSILPTKDRLYIATNYGQIYTYNNSKWDSITYNYPLVSNHAINTTQIFEDHKNKIWLTGNAGLFYIENDTIKRAPVKRSDIKNWPFIISISEGHDGALWMGSTGALQYKDSIISSYDKNNGFTESVTRCIKTDKEGNIWFGTNGNGIFRFSGGQFSIVDEKTGLDNEQVMAIAATPKGRVYFGTYLGGVYYYEHGIVNKYTLPLPKNITVQAIDIKNSDDIWLGTNGFGLMRNVKGELRKYTTPLIPSNTIVTLYRDSEDRLWIGTGYGATIYHDEKFTPVGNAKNVVSAFITIGADSVLMATSAGMQLYDNKEVTPFITSSAADSSNAQCFAISKSKLWIGTTDNGVICYDLKTKESFTINKSNGLKSDFVYNIITDNDHNIWVGTGYGIHKIELRNTLPTVTFYGRGQGVYGMESNQNAVYKMSDGSIWFGTTKGALHYQPKMHAVKAKPVSIVLQSVKLFGNNITDTSYYDSLSSWYNIPQNLVLPYKKNNLTFTFQAITMSGLEPIQYKYKIDGLDAPWSDWTSLNSITYSALQPGNYTLRVITNATDSTNSKELTYSFSIVAPFHKTSWFRLLILLGCILLGISFQYIINKRKQNRLALLERLRKEEQNKVRDRTAEDFHDEVGNKLTRINVLTNVLKSKNSNLSPESKRILDLIQFNTGELYNGTRDILWSLKPSNDNLFEIINRIRDFGEDLFSETEINFEYAKTDERFRNYRLPLDVSRNVIMIFKEAMNNSLKYAIPHTVKMEAALKPDHILQIILSDDGKGFDIETVERGNGLHNMENRAKRINGKLYIDSFKNKGTAISLSFKLQAPSKK
ncbi:MAG: two-component regulator propeller domain-containing protein [Flavipsychrobacter sp.]